MVSYLESPVLIVGAGPTGLLFANLLGQAGVETLIIDKNSSVSLHPKAILLDDEGFRSLQAVGASDLVKKNCVMGYGARYYNDKGVCFAKVSSSSEEYGYPKRNSFLQPDLEKALEENLKKFSSITFLRSTSLETFCDEASGVHSVLSSSSKKIEVKSKLLIGCDGGKSSVRTLSNIPLKGFGYDSDWVVLDTENDPDKDPYTKFICDYKRPFVSIPAPSGGRRYEFMLCEGEKGEDVLKKEALRKILSPFRSVLKDEDITRACVYRFSACVAESFRKGRVFLAGDSCHMTPPFAGQGMNTGLRDAHNLAWKVTRYIKGLSPLSLLESYEKERLKKVAEMVQFAVTLGEIVMPKTELDAKVMSTVWKLASLVPEAKKYVEEMKFKPKPHYEEGAFVFSDKKTSLRRRAIGKMFPQPKVKDFFGKEMLLDYFLGDSFSLVGCGLSSLESLEKFEHRLFPNLKKVLILSSEGEFPSSETKGVSLVLLEDKNSWEILKRSDFLYLVRPDRYIFLEASSKDFEGNIESVSGVL